MSDKDKPANPFGRVERTIMRPNPGGRLPLAPDPIRNPPPGRVHRLRAPYSPTPPSASSVLGIFPAIAGLMRLRPRRRAPEEWVN